MADSIEKQEQTAGDEKLDDPMELHSPLTTEGPSKSPECNHTVCQNKSPFNEIPDKKVVDELMEVLLSVNNDTTTLTIETNKLSNLSENTAKRSKSKDESDDNDISNKSNSDSDEDLSKRQKLNENQANTSTNDNSQENNDNKDSSFHKLDSKIKKRNYRDQRSSNDIEDDISDQQINQAEEKPEENPEEKPEGKPEENAPEESSSDESIEFQPREHFDDSSDERNENLEDNGDSNEWSTASDDTDEIIEVLQKQPSKSDWSILKDIVNRQTGFNYSIPRRFYSSLHAVQRLELMYKLEEHLGCVNALGFNQKGNLLASASDDLQVTIWDWAIGKKHVALKSGHRSNVFQSKWLPLDTESFVVSCARDGQVRLIDVRTSVTRKLAQHRLACHKISVHLDLPHIILSAGEDSKVLSIDVRENKPTKLLFVKDDEQEVELYSIHSNPLNSNEFCVAGRTRTVRIYDRRKPTIPLHQLCPKHLLSDEQAHVTCAVYNHNGTEVIASYNNEDIYLFDTAQSYQQGDFAHRYQGHCNKATVKAVNYFGPNSEYILSGSDCGNIFIWDKKTEAIVQWMAGDEQGIVNALEPHPHIPILATSGLDYDVKIWIPSREETPNIKKDLQSCVKKNLTSRTKSIGEAESAFDGHVLWIMLRHIRQAERRRQLRIRSRNRDRDEFNDESDNDDEDESENNNDTSSSTSSDDSNESDSHSES